LDESALVQAFAEQDNAQWQVWLRFNPTGSELFGEITSANLHRALAMLMDGKLLWAPRINSKITSSAVIVTDGMTETQARALAAAIESARLAASTQPTTRGN
jgi:preprotein translocase subunit SecD